MSDFTNDLLQFLIFYLNSAKVLSLISLIILLASRALLHPVTVPWFVKGFSCNELNVTLRAVHVVFNAFLVYLWPFSDVNR